MGDTTDSASVRTLLERPGWAVYAPLLAGAALLAAGLAFSHWLILAGLHSYFQSPGNEPVRWFSRFWILVAVSAAINPYLAAISVLIALTGAARLLVERRVGFSGVAMLSVVTLGILLIASTSVGTLGTQDPSAFWAPGYGVFSLNLNAIVNPMSYGSILLPALPIVDPMQIEGYNYLGLGIIALAVLNFIRRPQVITALKDRTGIPLVGLALLCTALAVSATVSFGSSKLFEVPVPGLIAPLLHGFRASSRFFWPAYYLIIIATLAMTFSCWKGRARTVILAVAVAVQFADLLALRTTVHATNSRRYDSPLTSTAWQGLGQKYDDLILVPPYQCDPLAGAGGPSSYVWFGQLASAEGMRLNSYYAARYTKREVLAHCVDLLRSQLAGSLSPRSAYLVTDDVQTVWSLAGVRSHRCERVDA